jgi:hypothetical protein
VVFVKDRQASYLALQEQGGARTPSSGKALVLPGPGMRLNQYGNIPRGRLERLRAAAIASHGKGSRDSGVAYLPAKAPSNKGPVGYFQRLAGHRLQRLTAFLPSAAYKPRFGFIGRVETIALANFPARLAERLAAAIASAR